MRKTLSAADAGSSPTWRDKILARLPWDGLPDPQRRRGRGAVERKVVGSSPRVGRKQPFFRDSGPKHLPEP